MNPSAQGQGTHHETGKPVRTVEILVNTKPVHVLSEVTGTEIKAAAQLPADFRLFRIQGHQEVPVGDDELLRVHHHQKFIASPTLDPAFVADPTHAAAIETVRGAFPSHELVVEEPGDGTTVVTVRDIDVGT